MDLQGQIIGFAMNRWICAPLNICPFVSDLICIKYDHLYRTWFEVPNKARSQGIMLSHSECILFREVWRHFWVLPSSSFNLFCFWGPMYFFVWYRRNLLHWGMFKAMVMPLSTPWHDMSICHYCGSNHLILMHRHNLSLSHTNKTCNGYWQPVWLRGVITIVRDNLFVCYHYRFLILNWYIRDIPINTMAAVALTYICRLHKYHAG